MSVGVYWTSHHEYSRYMAPGLYVMVLVIILMWIVNGSKGSDFDIIGAAFLGLAIGLVLNSINLYKIFPRARNNRESFMRMVESSLGERCRKGQGDAEYPSCFHRAIDMFMICVDNKVGEYIRNRLDSAILKLNISAISFISLELVGIFVVIESIIFHFKHVDIYPIRALLYISLPTLGFIFPLRDGLKDLKRNYYLVETALKDPEVVACINDPSNRIRRRL